jgi:hypothetical protein
VLDAIRATVAKPDLMTQLPGLRFELEAARRFFKSAALGTLVVGSSGNRTSSGSDGVGGNGVGAPAGVSPDENRRGALPMSFGSAIGEGGQGGRRGGVRTVRSGSAPGGLTPSADAASLALLTTALSSEGDPSTISSNASNSGSEPVSRSASA